MVSPGVATVAGSSPVVTLIAYFSKTRIGVKTTTVCASSWSRSLTVPSVTVRE